MSKPEQRASFSGPHRFVAPDDDRMGAALGAGHTPGLAMSWVADSTRRARDGVRCAVCGKARQDPIHMPPD